MGLIVNNNGLVRSDVPNASGAVAKDLLKLDTGTGNYIPRTSVSDAIDGICMETYSTKMTIIVGNGLIPKHTGTWGYTLGATLREDTTTPKNIVSTGSGKIIAKMIGTANVVGEAESLKVVCFDAITQAGRNAENIPTGNVEAAVLQRIIFANSGTGGANGVNSYFAGSGRVNTTGVLPNTTNLSHCSCIDTTHLYFSGGFNSIRRTNLSTAVQDSVSGVLPAFTYPSKILQNTTHIFVVYYDGGGLYGCIKIDKATFTVVSTTAVPTYFCDMSPDGTKIAFVNGLGIQLLTTSTMAIGGVVLNVIAGTYGGLSRQDNDIIWRFSSVGSRFVKAVVSTGIVTQNFWGVTGVATVNTCIYDTNTSKLIIGTNLNIYGYNTVTGIATAYSSVYFVSSPIQYKKANNGQIIAIENNNPTMTARLLKADLSGVDESIGVGIGAGYTLADADFNI